MRRLARIILPSVLLLVLSTWAFPVGAEHNADEHFKMDLLFQSPKQATHSDLAF